MTHMPDDTPHVVVWVSSDHSQFKVIKNTFKHDKDPNSSEHFNDSTAYQELSQEICHIIMKTVKDEFPSEKESIMPHTDIIHDLGGTNKHLTSIFIRLNELIGIDEELECTKWRTPLDIYQCYKSILRDI